MPVKKDSKTTISATQLYLHMSEIRDNVVVLKDGAFRVVLKTSSVNFDLKSEKEQEAIIYSYEQFLNSLQYPIQFLIKSRKLQLDNYIEMLKKKAVTHYNELLRDQTYEYIEYITKLLDVADLMRKEFYVVVPYEPSTGLQSETIIDKIMHTLNPADSVESIKKRHKYFEENRQRAQQRSNSVKSFLESIDLRVAQLTTQQLIELFYESYNPVIAYEEKVEDPESFNIDTSTGELHSDSEDQEDSKNTNTTS